MASQLTLKDIEPIAIKHGGYRLIGQSPEDYFKMKSVIISLNIGNFGYNPDLWPNTAHSRVRIMQTIGLKKGAFSYSLTPTELEALIRCLQLNFWWTRRNQDQFQARLIVESNGVAVASSMPIDFSPPIEPVKANDITLADNVDLLYPPRAGDGSLLFQTSDKSDFFGQYFFCSGGKFVIDPIYRGFDCSSFLRTAMGVYSDLNLNALSKADNVSYGAEIAKISGMQSVAEGVERSWLIEKAKSKELEESIILVNTRGKHPSSENHCVYHSNGSVYEFQEPRFAQQLNLSPTDSNGGFVTPLTQWRSGKHNELSYTYTVWS